MSEVPEVFDVFEKKLAQVLSFTLVTHPNSTKKAVEELLTYFSSVVERASKAESRIAELEGENKKAFDFVKTLRTYCVYAHWDNPDTEGEFNEFDVEVCKWLSEFMEREE